MDKAPVLKLILIGKSGVGKTSIVRRYAEGEFDHATLKPTIEDEVKVLYVAINGIKVVLRISDTVGMERFDCLPSSFYRESHGVIVVYDVTNMESFHSVSSCLKQAQEHCEGAAVLIVGNKTDKLGGNVVNVRTIERLADMENYDFVETSALDGSNIESAFHRLLRLILVRTELVESDEEVDIKMLPKPSPNEMAALDLQDEQDDKKRKYKRALEKVLQKQLSAEKERVILKTDQITEYDEDQSSNKAPAKRCGC